MLSRDGRHRAVNLCLALLLHYLIMFFYPPPKENSLEYMLHNV